MRKQYHFWPSEGGLLAWDVQRLIEQSEELLPRDVPIAELRDFDQVYWFDDEQEKPTCRAVVEHIKLIEAADLSYPIILASDGRVMDGMHRVAKAVLLEREVICAVQFESDPTPDYVGKAPRELPY